MRLHYFKFLDKLVHSEGYSKFFAKMMVYSLAALLLGIVLWIFQGQFSNSANVVGLGCLSLLFFLKSFEKPLWGHRLLWWGITVLVMAALFLGAHWPGGLNLVCCGAALVILAAVLNFINKQNQI